MAVSTVDLCRDLMSETAVLEELLAPLDERGWSEPTPAEGWDVRDQISHLAFFDEAATTAATDPDRFRAEREAAVADVDAFTAAVAERYRDVDGPEMLG